MKTNRIARALCIAVALAVLATATVVPAASASTTDAQGTIYRLYKAYFEREPDTSGFDYWVRTYQSGYPLPDISNDFARSEEFQSRYGTVNDSRFLELVYNNVLDRAPDQGGYDYWLDHMNRGMPRGYVMIYFSDSEEFRNKVGDGPSNDDPPSAGPVAESTKLSGCKSNTDAGQGTLTWTVYGSDGSSAARSATRDPGVYEFTSDATYGPLPSGHRVRLTVTREEISGGGFRMGCIGETY